MDKFMAQVLGWLAQADTPIDLELNDRNPTISVSTTNMDLELSGAVVAALLEAGYLQPTWIGDGERLGVELTEMGLLECDYGRSAPQL